MRDLLELRDELRRFAAEREWDQFHSPKNLAMALAVEAAELMEPFQWLTEAESAASVAKPYHWENRLPNEQPTLLKARLT